MCAKEREYDILNMWFDINRLSLKKTQFMLFVTKKGCKENIELKVFNTKIKTVSDVKSYEQHFHYIIGKMSKLLCVLYNTKHLLELYI